MPTSISCTNLSFAWPDGTTVFEDFSFAVGPGRGGIVGANGSGKSTLMRLIAGALSPSSGSVTVDGTLGYVRQDLTLDRNVRVDEVLGVADKRAALRAIENGSTDEQDFTTIGDDWDIEEQVAASLSRTGLDHVGPDRTTRTMSGGESVLLSIAAQLLNRPNVLLLDEPTNNLDAGNSRRLHDVVADWPGTLLVVSHDRQLLNLVDGIGDLHGHELRWYGGGFDDYQAAVADEQATAARLVRNAQSDVRKQKRELSEALIRLDRRKRYGKKMNEQKREPKMIMNARKREAQVSSGKHRGVHEERLDSARNSLDEAQEDVRDDREIRVDLPETAIPARRQVLRLSGVEPVWGPAIDLDVRGPERIGITGANGSGKTTLLSTIMGQCEPIAGTVDLKVPAQMLPQRMDLLDDKLTVAENVAVFAPVSKPQEIRAQLARFLFRGRAADQSVGTLSGGELFRATLATILVTDPAPQLLLLDEPTNNLDLASLRHLSEALDSYAGALIVVSHDEDFLMSLNLDRTISLEPGRSPGDAT